VTKTCSQVLACSATPTDGITALAPGYVNDWETWTVYDGDTAADASQASLASIALMSEFGSITTASSASASTSTPASPSSTTTAASPTRTLAIWAFLDSGDGVEADTWVAQPGAYVDQDPPQGACTLNNDAQSTPQPSNGNGHVDDLPGSWAFSSPIYGLTSCTFTATDTAAANAPTGTLLCPGLPSSVECPPPANPTDISCFFNDDSEEQDPLALCVF
jgi:hypothetical protein